MRSVGYILFVIVVIIVILVIIAIVVIIAILVIILIGLWSFSCLLTSLRIEEQIHFYSQV